MWFKCQRVRKHWNDWDTFATYRESKSGFGWCRLSPGKTVTNLAGESQPWKPTDAKDTPQAHGHYSDMDDKRLAMSMGAELINTFPRPPTGTYLTPGEQRERTMKVFEVVKEAFPLYCDSDDEGLGEARPAVFSREFLAPLRPVTKAAVDTTTPPPVSKARPAAAPTTNNNPCQVTDNRLRDINNLPEWALAGLPPPTPPPPHTFSHTHPPLHTPNLTQTITYITSHSQTTPFCYLTH